jgi:hypothetical protein
MRGGSIGDFVDEINSGASERVLSTDMSRFVGTNLHMWEYQRLQYVEMVVVPVRCCKIQERLTLD